MYNENSVSLIGRVGGSPELTFLGEGAHATPQARFKVATNRRWRDKSGETRADVEWHHVIAYGRTARFAAEHLLTGRLVRVLGRLKTRSYSLGGQTHFRTEVVVETLSPLDPAPEESAAVPEAAAG